MEKLQTTVNPPTTVYRSDLEDGVPRPERPLDPQNPVHMFAFELRKFREEHGSPKYLVMARRAGDVSRTALSEAAGGDHVPTWRTVEAFVRACGGDPQLWRPRWERLRDAGDPLTQGSESEPATTDTNGAATSATGGRATLKRRRAVLVCAATSVAAAMLVFVLDRWPATTTTAPSSAGPTVVVVDNKVAMGPDDLIEDVTPVYLSSQPRPYCRSQGCRIDRTDMWSGALVVATCHTTGAMMTNYNLDADSVRRNPHRVESTLWYRLELPDGRAGYLSEVYLRPEYRGGLGLPTCRPDVPIATPVPSQP